MATLFELNIERVLKKTKIDRKKVDKIRVRRRRTIVAETVGNVLEAPLEFRSQLLKSVLKSGESCLCNLFEHPDQKACSKRSCQDHAYGLLDIGRDVLECLEGCKDCPAENGDNY